MKKIMITLATMLMLSTAWAFTGEEAINKQALDAFKTEFAGATNAAWSVADDHYKVAFTLHDQQLYAYYSTEGEFIAVTRYISPTLLPLNLQYNLRKFYKNYWVSDLFEVADSNNTTYYVTLENRDGKIVLKSIGGSDWSVHEKIRKA